VDVGQCQGNPTKRCAPVARTRRLCRRYAHILTSQHSVEIAKMIVRLSKCALLFGVSLFFSLVSIDNTSDYKSNFEFVRHVLSMDTTFPGNHGLWRALPQPSVQIVFYIAIVLWEIATCVLSWWGAVRLTMRLRAPAAAFDQAKSVAVGALTLGCMLWLVAFIDVGGEWFLMWQSKTWNGQEAAFRMFVVLGLILIYLSQPEYRVDKERENLIPK
jgi:predicted small integral membrane protein